ncbi:MAG: L-asparaginase AnsA [Bacteroidetes bacterium HLUCCA01]|nr:MAG: L-asparaginase AnsA [Bacteroidetes bacterium HLUCCA01]
MKRVLIIQTGGTILMQTDQRMPGEVSMDPGLSKGFLLQEVPELSRIADLQIEGPFYEDSSNINPAHWKTLASCIATNYNEFDGFVILHGTDTMAFTASALSFALRPLTKPVIFTGSQVPLTTLRSDAHRNLINAVEIATMDVPEVGIVFDDKLYRGNRASKMSIGDFDAFASPNLPALAEIGLNIRFSSHIRPAGPTFHNTASFSDEVYILKVWPGINPDYLQPLPQSGIRGILIEGFGSGNFPVKGTGSLVPFLESCRDKAIVLAMCSQAPYDAIDLSKYESGRIAREIGILSAGSMTLEASVTKLMYLLAHHRDNGMVASQFVTDLAGELS